MRGNKTRNTFKWEEERLKRLVEKENMSLQSQMNASSN